MSKKVIVYFYDEKQRRIPVERLEDVPFIWGSRHDEIVKEAPALKEKELYALYEGTEFLVWPTNPDQNIWSSHLVLGKTEYLTPIDSLADEIGKKLLEVKPSPVVKPKSDEPITYKLVADEAYEYIHKFFINDNIKKSPEMIEAISKLYTNLPKFPIKQ